MLHKAIKFLFPLPLLHFNCKEKLIPKGPAHHFHPSRIYEISLWSQVFAVFRLRTKFSFPLHSRVDVGKIYGLLKTTRLASNHFSWVHLSAKQFISRFLIINYFLTLRSIHLVSYTWNVILLALKIKLSLSVIGFEEPHRLDYFT